MIGANGTLTGYAGGLYNKELLPRWKAFCESQRRHRLSAARPSGASFLFMRVAVPEFGPFALIGLRSGLAAYACGRCCLRAVAKPGGARCARICAS